MQLQEFITQTLTQIIQGVSVARTNMGVCVAPELDVDPTESEHVFQTRGDAGLGQAFLVSFDVAVTAAEKSSVGGEGGIQVMSFFSAKGEKSQATESSSVSRIQFQIPISYVPHK